MTTDNILFFSIHNLPPQKLHFRLFFNLLGHVDVVNTSTIIYEKMQQLRRQALYLLFYVSGIADNSLCVRIP